MSGHSKWHRIRHKKALTDQKRSKLFGGLSQDIRSAARDGSDPDKNPRLREAIERAKAHNVPQANIDRLLNRGAVPIEDVLYEGYGAGGVALLISAATDNTNRTVAELRASLKKHGGSLSAPNSVRWKFAPQLSFAMATSRLTDDLELALIEAGANDIVVRDAMTVVWAAPEAQRDFEAVIARGRIALADSLAVRYRVAPDQQVPLSTAQRESLHALLDVLQEHPDVLTVYTDAQESF